MSKNKILKLLCIVMILFISYMVVFYFNFFQDTINVDAGKTICKVQDDFTPCYTSNIKFDDIPFEDVSNAVSIKILNFNLAPLKIYERSLRYYIPLNIVCSKLNYKINNNTLSNNSTTITFKDDKSCYINNIYYELRGNLLTIDNHKYISLSDIEYLFNLTAVFDFENKEINLLNKLADIKTNDFSISASGEAALIRLEDFSAGYGALDSENQLKYKCIGNFLKSNGIKFHVAWVPRFICPSQNIDNDLLINNSIENVGFINTLDYLINSGAEIGLHGYTHQTNNDTSLNGIELSYLKNSTEKETKEVIERAIDTAQYLNIPYSFFESPHYKATIYQKNIMERYFQFIYEPRNIFIYNKLQKHNKNLYIPTPLGYVQNYDTSRIEKHLKSPTPGELASLFYHPALELKYIDIKILNNDISISYNKNSPLYKIVKSIQDNNYVTIHISDFKKQNN